MATKPIWKAVVFSIWLLLFAILVYSLLLRPNLFPLVFAICFVISLLGMIGMVVASIVHRLRTGKYIFTPRFPDAIFTERWLSGHGHKQFLLLRTGASNCLWLAVLDGRLLVGPMFPFNLMSMPKGWGLDYDLAASDIIDVTKKSRGFGRSMVTIRFRSEADAENEIGLAVRDSDGFVSVMNSLAETIKPAVHPPQA